MHIGMTLHFIQRLSDIPSLNGNSGSSLTKVYFAGFASRYSMAELLTLAACACLLSSAMMQLSGLFYRLSRLLEDQSFILRHRLQCITQFNFADCDPKYSQAFSMLMYTFP